MTNSPALIDWQNPRTDHWAWDSMVLGLMAVPGRKGWKTSKWRSLDHRKVGTLTNMDPAADWVTGSHIGGLGGLEFVAGSSQYIASIPAAELSNLPALTLSCWCKRTGSILGFGTPGNSSTDRRIQVLWFSDNKIYFTCHDNFPSYSLSQSDWVMLSMVYDRGAIRGFVNGKLVASGSTTITTTSSLAGDFQVGTTGASRFTTGCHDGAFVWTRALSDSGIAALYEESRRGYPTMLRRLPTRRYFFPPASGGATVSLTSATQTDSANAVAIVNPRTYTLGTASESETANAVTVQQAAAVSLGNATETDVANAVSVVNPRSYQLGNATDSSAANALSVVNPRSYTLGNASESDAANAVAITNASTVSLGTASESCVANSLTISNPRTYTLTTASEVSIGRAATVVNPRSYSIGNAAESNTANALTVSLPGQTTAGYILVRNATLKTGKATATLRTGHATATLIS